MAIEFYKPEKTVAGPAYSQWFKLVATIVSVGLGSYAASIAMRYPLLQYGFSGKMLLPGAAAMLALSYYWFLRSTIRIDDKGIPQTRLYHRHVEWRDARTGVAFSTFSGWSQEILIQSAKISFAFQMKK